MIEIRRNYKIAVVDIETTGLKADYADVVCVVIKEYKGKIWTIRIDDSRNPDPKSDKWVVEETFRILEDFDVLVTWNGTRFDKPFLNTRAFLNGTKKMLHPMYNRDLIYPARHKFLFGSRRLKFVATVVLGKTDKTFTKPSTWKALVRFEKWAIDFMVDHCRRDVKDTEKLYTEFLPYLSEKIERR